MPEKKTLSADAKFPWVLGIGGQQAVMRRCNLRAPPVARI